MNQPGTYRACHATHASTTSRGNPLGSENTALDRGLDSLLPCLAWRDRTNLRLPSAPGAPSGVSVRRRSGGSGLALSCEAGAAAPSRRPLRELPKPAGPGLCLPSRRRPCRPGWHGR